MKLAPSGETELKHSEFKRIPYPARSMIAERIARTLVEHGTFVSGFYRPAQSFVMEHVRDAVMYEEKLPDDVSVLYRKAVEEVRDSYYTKGEKSQLLTALLLLPMSAWANMLGSYDCPFRIVYDPRERQEDLSVKERIERLQLSDLIAGETREFLAAYPEMMSHGATRRIISQGSRERYEAIDVLRMEGKQPMVYKVGAMTKMTKSMVRSFLTHDREGRTVLHLFSPLLVSGSLSCYSTTGNPRHIMPFIAGILDQADR